MTGTLLTLLMPSSAFLDDDIESLLGGHGPGSGGEWLGILLVPESSWSSAELATAVRNVKKRSQAASVVMSPQLMDETLQTMARRCPEGGTVVLAWPGGTDEGLSLLRRVRQTSADARTPAPSSSSLDEQPAHVADGPFVVL